MVEVNTPDTGIDDLPPIDGALDEASALEILTHGRKAADAPAGDNAEAAQTEEAAKSETDEGAEPDADGADNDDDEAAKDKPSEGEDPAKPIIEIDGKPLTAEDVRKGFLRQSDYTRKTQEVAEMRKAVEAERANASMLRDEYASRLEVILSSQPQMQEPNWAEMAQQDPLGFVVARENWRVRQEQMQRLTEESNHIRAQQEAERSAIMQNLLAQERDKLLSVVPEWKDKSKAQADIAAIKSFVADAYGFSDTDLDGLHDHRAVMVLRDAMAYRKAIADKAIAETKAKDKPPVNLKSGNRQAPDAIKSQKHAENMRRLKKTGSMQDALRALTGI